MRRGLYYSYIITSQSYSAARPISDSNSFNKLDIAAELVYTIIDTTIDVIIDIIIDTECYIGGDSFFIQPTITNSHFIVDFILNI